MVFLKRSDKLPESEKEKALRYKKDYTDRTEKNIYYKDLDNEESD